MPRNGRGLQQLAGYGRPLQYIVQEEGNLQFSKVAK